MRHFSFNSLGILGDLFTIHTERYSLIKMDNFLYENVIQRLNNLEHNFYSDLEFLYFIINVD